MLDVLKSFLEEIGEVKDKYLVSCFLQNGEWKVDFYSKEKHKLYIYSKVNGKVVVQEDEIFQKEEKPLEELDLDKVKVGYEEAVQKVEVSKEKIITILQVINGKIVWNLTVLMPTLELYNLKIDAVSGETISEKKENIMDFRKEGSVSG